MAGGVSHENSVLLKAPTLGAGLPLTHKSWHIPFSAMGTAIFGMVARYPRQRFSRRKLRNPILRANRLPLIRFVAAAALLESCGSHAQRDCHRAQLHE